MELVSSPVQSLFKLGLSLCANRAEYLKWEGNPLIWFYSRIRTTIVLWAPWMPVMRKYLIVVSAWKWCTGRLAWLKICKFPVVWISSEVPEATVCSVHHVEVVVRQRSGSLIGSVCLVELQLWHASQGYKKKVNNIIGLPLRLNHLRSIRNPKNKRVLELGSMLFLALLLCASSRAACRAWTRDGISI